MKKLLFITLCAALILSFAGCKGEEKENEPAQTEAQSDTAPVPAEPEPEEDILDLGGSWGLELGMAQLLELNGYSLDTLLLEQFEITPDPAVFDFTKNAAATLTFDGEGKAQLTITGAEFDAVMLDGYRVICDYLSNYDNAEALYYQNRFDLDQRAAARFSTESWQLGMEKLYNEYCSAVSDAPSSDITISLAYEETDEGILLDSKPFSYAEHTLTGKLAGMNTIVTKQ